MLTYVREMAMADQEFNGHLNGLSGSALLLEAARVSSETRLTLPGDVSALRAFLREQHAAGAVYRAARSQALARLTVLRRLTGLGKVDTFIGWLKEFFEENPDEKFIAFAHHVACQQRIIDAFPGCAIIGGKQKTQDTDENKNGFQRDPKCKLIVVSATSGDEGLNLSAARNMGILEYPWTAKGLNQMEGRAFLRLDNPHGIVAHYFVAPQRTSQRAKYM